MTYRRRKFGFVSFASIPSISHLFCIGNYFLGLGDVGELPIGHDLDQVGICLSFISGISAICLRS